MSERPPFSEYTDWNNDLTPLTLWSRVCSGDGDAWGKLVTVWTPCIAWKCKQMGLSKEEVEDVTQLVMIRVFRYRDRFSAKKKGHRLKFWLLMIINQCIEDRRRKFSSKSKATGGDSHHEQIANTPGFGFDPNAIQPDAPSEDEELFDRNIWMTQLLAVIEQESSELT